MSWLRSPSLQVRLATRLGAVFLAATLILAGGFFYLSYDLADSLSRRDLFRLADELADEIEDEGHLEDLDRFVARGWLNENTRYLILDRHENILAQSDPEFEEAILAGTFDYDRTLPFHLEEFGTPPQTYFGLVTTERTRKGRLTVIVAEPDRAERELLDAIMNDIVFRAAWVLPLFIFITLWVAVLAIRGSLRPLRKTAEEAAAISPEAISVRLGTKNIPREVSPLVTAINSALDRLEAGFEQQRRFTANAAHELRTPLTIITGALENLEGDGQVDKLRQDVARMNRLVEQLLHAARLDSLQLDTSEEVDLNQVARQVIESLAPLAIHRDKTLNLVAARDRVMVWGNLPAMEDALRNLVENAIVHGSPDTQIDVEVIADGSLSVCDRGPGIAEEDRDNLFDRFWRGRQANNESSGAGLGLAIVQEIMKLHGGSVRVTDNEAGGTCFKLCFRLKD